MAILEPKPQELVKLESDVGGMVILASHLALRLSFNERFSRTVLHKISIADRIRFQAELIIYSNPEKFT